MKGNASKLHTFLKILADESKLRIILHLMKGEECVCTIAEELNMEQSLVSHHLSVLREAGLVNDRKVGTWIHCSLNKKRFEEMEKAYQQLLSSVNISGKLCTSHEICQRLKEAKS